MKPTQQSLATTGFEIYRKRTRRDEFLSQMDPVVPWAKLCAQVEPVYPKGDGAGRTTVGLERMLRIYFLQQWFNLSDPAVEEALYDSASMRQFVGTICVGRRRRMRPQYVNSGTCWRSIGWARRSLLKSTRT
jgi:IS5 family transposase